MFKWLNKRRGQNTAEYAILIGVIVAAAVAMQLYLKRNMQGKVKDAIDLTGCASSQAGLKATDIGYGMFTGNQFEPVGMGTNFSTVSESNASEQMLAGGEIFRNTIRENTTRKGSQIYNAEM